MKCIKCDKEAIRGGLCNSCSCKEWYAKNKDKVKIRKEKWYIQNRERTIEKTKEWRKANPERVKNNELNRDKVKNAKYYKDRYQNDLDYRLKVIIRNRLRTALKHDFKSGRTLDLLGCSIEDYKKYIESKWQEGMTWDNHTNDGWHIDHIIPLDSFDLSDPEQLRKASHFSNTQPMWHKDNLQKSNKLC